MNALIKLRRHVADHRGIASAIGKLDKVQAFDSVLDAIDAALKRSHDRKHDRRKR